MTYHRLTHIICGLALVALGCDGLFGALDAPIPSSDMGANNLEDSGSADVGSDSGVEQSFDELWTSAQCGGGQTPGCQAGEVCLAGKCGEVVALESGANTFCAVQLLEGSPRVFCWGDNAAIRDPGMSNPDRNWGAIPNAIEGDETFHSLAVGTTFACVLVSSGDGEGDRLTHRCWGSFVPEQQTDLPPPFWGGTIDLAFDSNFEPQVVAGGITACVTGLFDGYDAPAVACLGSESGVGIASGNTQWGDLENELGAGLAETLAPPYEVAFADKLACRSTSEGALGNDVSCSGELGDESLTSDREGTGVRIGEHQEIAAGRHTLCAITGFGPGTGVFCRGWSDQAQMSSYSDGAQNRFDLGTAAVFWERLAVTDQSGICAARTDANSDEVVECFFSADDEELLVFTGVPDHYAIIPNGLCAVFEDPDTELRCFGLGDLWPGVTAEPVRP